jgi:hypothetical protein
MDNREQLCLFETVSDSDRVSLTENVSDAQSAKRKAIERYLGQQKENIACVNIYSPGRRSTEYYRLSYRFGRSVRHVHIKGGSTLAELATYRANRLRELIDRGAELAEILAMVATFNGVSTAR